MFTAFLVTLGIVGYLKTGSWLGRTSWKTWKNKKRSKAAFLLFPISYSEDKVGNDYASNVNVISIYSIISTYSKNDGNDEKGKETYVTIVALTWSSKVVLNTLLILLYGLWGVASTGIKALTHPTSLLPKQPPKELPAATVVPDLGQFPIDERLRLLEQRDKIDARLKEIDAHPDKEKILAQARRL